MNIGCKIIAFGLLLVVCPRDFASPQRVSQSWIEPSIQDPDPISLTVTVTNKKGLLISGLKREDFDVSIDKVPAKITECKNEDSPVSVGILVDVSASMSRQILEKIKNSNLSILQQAVTRFLSLGNQLNEYFVLGFNNRVELTADWSSDPKTIVEKLPRFQTDGNTAFYDACYIGLDKVQHGRYAKRVLLLVSDGQDNSSHYSFKDVREMLKQSNVVVYSVSVSSGPDAGSSLGQEGAGILEEFSFISGGVTFAQKQGVPLEPPETVQAFELIANDLRNQYSIAIAPSNRAAPKTWRKIKVKVSRPASPELRNLAVRTREGYYSY